jgi:hypothetical protein
VLIVLFVLPRGVVSLPRTLARLVRRARRRPGSPTPDSAVVAGNGQQKK